MIKKFMHPPQMNKHVTPSAHSAENIHFGGYFIEQNFQISLKFVAIQ